MQAEPNNLMTFHEVHAVLQRHGLFIALTMIGAGALFGSSPAEASCAPQAPLHLWPDEWRDLEHAVYKALPPNAELDADSSDVCRGRPRDFARLETRHARSSGGEESWWQVKCSRGFGSWNCSSTRKARMQVAVGRQRVAMTFDILGDTPLATASDLVRRAARVFDDPAPTLMRCLGPAGPYDRDWRDLRARMLAATDLQPVVAAEKNVARVSFAHQAGIAIHFQMAAGDPPQPLAECWREDVEIVVVE
jgi:hypothetical protein